jgi:hypothetical protein
MASDIVLQNAQSLPVFTAHARSALAGISLLASSDSSTPLR